MAEEKEKKTGCLNRARRWFVQLSFWKKIIIIFTLNTIILLILTDSIMLVLFGKISNDIITTSNSQKEEFNQLANGQIVQASAKMVLSQIDFYASILAQMANTYTYFTQNSQIYTSLQSSNPQNPKLTSSFPNVSYAQTAYFYLNSESTFTPLPFIDQLMPYLLQDTFYSSKVKRVNVYVQSNTVPNDLTARTFPATSDFNIPNLTTITDRFIGTTQGEFSISLPYQDVLTMAITNMDTLVGLRTTFLSSDNRSTIMMEVELQQSIMANLLQKLYYFPTATVMLVSIANQQVNYYTNLPSQHIQENINVYYPLGFNRDYTQQNSNGDLKEESKDDYISASAGLASSYPLGGYSSITNSSTNTLRCIVVVNAADTEIPAIQLQGFLAQQTNTLIGIVLSWSFVILLSTVALATVVGNYIFHNLKMLSTKMDQYIKDPSKFHSIAIELKELQLKGILKRLSDNLIAIIEKIEVRKKQKKDRINQNYHPLSVGQPKFQERQQLNDYEIIDNIKLQVKERVEQLKREEAQKAEKERIQKEAAEVQADIKKEE